MLPTRKDRAALLRRSLLNGPTFIPERHGLLTPTQASDQCRAWAAAFVAPECVALIPEFRALPEIPA
jgi:hypothetical protein